MSWLHIYQFYFMVNEHSRDYTDLILFEEALNVMGEFQLLHNLLRHDYIVLVQLTDKYVNSPLEFFTLYNSCLIRLFTMIEADMYGLYRLDPYPGKKATNFFHQFPNIFNQICSTWRKEDVKNNYFKNHWDELCALKNLRNSFTHPKNRTHVLPATIADFKRLRDAWDNYNMFMGEITNNFYVGFRGNLNDIDIDAIIKRKEEKGITLSQFTARVSWNTASDNDVE